MARRYVIGLGNHTMSDDGVGLRVAEYIAQSGLEDGFESVSLADSGVRLLDYFTPDTEKIVVVDSALLGLSPGECRVFGPGDVETRKILGRRSTHEGDILSVIELGRSLQYTIPPISILGIQPVDVESGLSLTPAIAGRVKEYAETAVREIRA